MTHILMSPQLATKLFSLKAACPNLVKSQTAQIGKKFSYNFAPLEEIDAVLREPCEQLKLHYFWQCESTGGINTISCIVMDTETGEVLTSSISFAPDSSDFQEVGKQFTYYSRYLLCGILGLVAVKDDDGNGSSAPPARRRSSRPPVDAEQGDDDEDEYDDDGGDDDEEDDDEDEAPAPASRRSARPARTGKTASTRRGLPVAGSSRNRRGH